MVDRWLTGGCYITNSVIGLCCPDLRLGRKQVITASLQSYETCFGSGDRVAVGCQNGFSFNNSSQTSFWLMCDESMTWQPLTTTPPTCIFVSYSTSSSHLVPARLRTSVAWVLNRLDKMGVDRWGPAEIS